MVSCALVAVVMLPAGHRGEFSVFYKGKLVGSEVRQFDYDRAGRLHETSRMTLGGKTVSNISEFEDLKHRPTRIIIKHELPRYVREVVETFAARALTVTITASGHSTAKTYAIPKGELESPVNLWFRSKLPAPGTTATYIHFNSEKMAWETLRCTYTGKEIVPGTSTSAHHMAYTRRESWFDGKGYLLRETVPLEKGVLVLVRKPGS
jgi:hypothetical protein